jgi:hypothetical protein
MCYMQLLRRKHQHLLLLPLQLLLYGLALTVLLRSGLVKIPVCECCTYVHASYPRLRLCGFPFVLVSYKTVQKERPACR